MTRDVIGRPGREHGLADMAVKQMTAPPDGRYDESPAHRRDGRHRVAPPAPMPTSHTTRLALQLTRLALDADRLARQLAAEERLKHEPLLRGAMYLLATALGYLDGALYSAENDGHTRRANFLAAARVIAYPDQVAQAA